MGVLMARAGRKRKDVARLAGRRDWRQLVEDPSLLTKWSRYRDRISELGGNPKLASQAGKLHYLRQLTTLEAEAAERWSRMLDENYRVVLGMSRTPPGATLQRVSRGGGHETAPDELKRFQARFRAAQDAISMAGTKALMAVNRLCHDEASSSVLPDARRGLAQLIKHFRLDAG